MSYVIFISTAKSTEKEAPKDDKKVVKRDRSKSATRKEDTKESASAKDDTVAMETDGAVKDQVREIMAFLHFLLLFFKYFRLRKCHLIAFNIQIWFLM